jgi:hypothetical protein
VYIDPGAGSLVLQVIAATAFVILSSMARLRQAVSRMFQNLLRMRRR